jgi:hypothetical protein
LPTTDHTVALGELRHAAAETIHSGHLARIHVSESWPDLGAPFSVTLYGRQDTIVGIVYHAAMLSGAELYRYLPREWFDAVARHAWLASDPVFTAEYDQHDDTLSLDLTASEASAFARALLNARKWNR